ncbi:MAG: response regulator [Desulfobacteraceae bacterium]|nr:response regulator [Desulfobacteraceae bacterium]
MSIQVLIVDDETDIPQTIKDYLEDETEFEVTFSFSGEDGLKMLNRVKPDVCIVDMRLPGMNGNEFILKTHEKLPESKFLVHTGSIAYSIPSELKRIGITKEFILAKPVLDLAVFHKKIKQLLQL